MLFVGVHVPLLIFAVLLHRCHVPDEESSGDEKFVDEEEDSLAQPAGDLDGDDDEDASTEDDTAGGRGGGVSRATRNHSKKGKVGEQEDDQDEEETQTNDETFLVAGGRGLLGRGSPITAAKGQGGPRWLVGPHFHFFCFVLVFFTLFYYRSFCHGSIRSAFLLLNILISAFFLVFHRGCVKFLGLIPFFK